MNKHGLGILYFGIKNNGERSDVEDKSLRRIAVQRALDSLRYKGYIKRNGAKQYSGWDILL